MNGLLPVVLVSWVHIVMVCPPSFLSHLCLSPAPSPSPSDSIQPRPPAFHHLCSNSAVYSCNYATSVLRLASDYCHTYSHPIPARSSTIYILPIICLIPCSLSILR